MSRKNNKRTNETAEEPLGQNDKPLRGSDAKGKKKFVEPTISVPVDVFEATTFFLQAGVATEPPP